MYIKNNLLVHFDISNINSYDRNNFTIKSLTNSEYEASANATVDTIWKVKVGDKLLEIKARDITPIQ